MVLLLSIPLILWGYSLSEISSYVRFYYIWATGSAVIATSIIFYNLIGIIRYFRYVAIVMREFTDPIEGDNIQDFVLWWQFRRHYIENDVRITGRVINVILSASVFISAIILMVVLHYLWFKLVDNNWAVDIVKIVVFLFILFAMILYLAQNGSIYYEEQTKHKKMLIREKLRIKAKLYNDNDENDENENVGLIGKGRKNDDGDMRTMENEQVFNVIDGMIVDIENTVVAIKMGGIKITPKVMVVIRGYIVSGVFAIIASAL